MLIDTVRKTIRTQEVLYRREHVILGLSGGPDSVCLFHVLQRLAEEYELTIHPVHVNHQLRPGDAERDQHYVEQLCREAAERGSENRRAVVYPCQSFTVDCNAMAKELGMTSEEAGRKARYDAFVQVAREVSDQFWPEPMVMRPRVHTRTGYDCSGLDYPNVVIAVAQNANDQAETILHRIIRGTGTDGLEGMAYVRSEQGIPVVRPLLDVPRKDIEAYCEENGLHPVTDHTNNEPVYTRNKIRLELLPQLEEYNPNIVETLARMGRIVAADKKHLWQKAEAAYQRIRIESIHPTTGELRYEGVVLDREQLAREDVPIRHRIIIRAFADAGLASDISEERLRAADLIITRKQAPKMIQFPHQHHILVKKGKVYFE